MCIRDSPKPWKNKVRTFRQNPGGFVAQENYDNDIAVVNGHSFKEKKSENTNLAILVSHNFTEPFNQPIAYAQKVGELTNMLGAGHIMVQRYGDKMCIRDRVRALKRMLPARPAWAAFLSLWAVI